MRRGDFPVFDQLIALPKMREVLEMLSGIFPHRYRQVVFEAITHYLIQLCCLFDLGNILSTVTRHTYVFEY